jgi:hypothetical protein
MRSRLFNRAPAHADLPDFRDYPEFPERADLPRLSDEQAEAALGLLRLLVAQDLATVYTRPYTPEGERRRWNVWDMTSGKGRRVELEPWAKDVFSPGDAFSEDAKIPIEDPIEGAP